MSLMGSDNFFCQILRTNLIFRITYNIYDVLTHLLLCILLSLFYVIKIQKHR